MEFGCPGCYPYSQGGDVVAVNLSTITNPVVEGTLSENGDPTYGGPSPFFGTALYSPQILYAGTTTDTGGTFTGGNGVLDVIDISNPAEMSILNQVTLPSPYQNLVAPIVQGNLLVARANT